MADEKKPKIDLKARLGKQAAVGGAPAPVPAPGIPAPGAVGATPAPGALAPVAAPSGGGVPAPMPVPVPMPVPGGMASPGGVPVPPFAQPAAAPAPKRGPLVDANDPFGSVAAADAPRAAPTSIKIEIGEEVVAAQAKASKKTVVMALMAAIVGLGLGYVWGGRAADAASAKRTLEGAQDLAGDIEKAQVKVKELNDKIGVAVKSLKEKKYPDTFVADLGGISIPFDASNFTGRNIGRFDPKTLKALFDYTSDVDTLNGRKDALRNLFGGQKQAIIDALASADSPKVSWNVFVQKSPAHGPIAILAAVNQKDAWGYKDKDWPAKYKISTGRELVDVERYTGSGDVFSSEKKVQTLPIDPDSIATAFPNDIIMRLTSELSKTGAVLVGVSGTPDEEDAGVIKKGDSLVVELRKIGKK
jgi:hypothetical protein